MEAHTAARRETPTRHAPARRRREPLGRGSIQAHTSCTSQQRTATRAACDCCTSSAPARSCQRRMHTRRHQRTMQQQTATRAACECCVNAGLMIDPLLKGLSRFRSATITAATHELEAKRSLATRSSTNEALTHEAAVAGHTGRVRLPVGNRRDSSAAARCAGSSRAAGGPAEDKYSCLLSEPRLLDLPTKQAWLSWSLEPEVDGAGAEQLELVCFGATICCRVCAGCLGDNGCGLGHG